MIARQNKEIVNENNAQDKALSDTVSKLKGDFAKLINDLRSQYT